MVTKDPILAAFAEREKSAPYEALASSPTGFWSVGEVASLARAVARSRLASLPDAGAVVGIVAPNGPGFVAGFLALRMVGAVVLLFDWRTPQSERYRCARALGAAAILEVDKQWPAGKEDFILREIERDTTTAVCHPHSGAATVRLTSGSTGNPQGIIHTSEALISDDHNLSLTMGLRADETILASVPLSHAYGFASILLPALRQRAVLAVPEMGRPFSAIETAIFQRVTVLPTVPAYLQAILDMREVPPLPPGLRLIISAGAPLSPETAGRFRARYGRPIHVFYGASETGGITFDRDGSAAERGTLGTPVENVRVNVEPIDGCDEDQGIVIVSSPSAATGYYPHPSSDLRDGSFRTRDLATFRDGELVLIGRVDDFINVKGLKLNPREVENVLEKMEGIVEAVVFGTSDPNGTSQVVCAVAAIPDTSIGRDRIRRWCQDHLAAHKVPRRIVTVDRIPRNARGKIDREAVRRFISSDD